jgi:FlaA1/EpsC-like NDP-sugar epimerase
LDHAWGGEIFIPKIPSYKITDVAEAVGPYCEQKVVGIRPGEKIHEEMITASDSFFTYDLGTYYCILPSKTVFSLEDWIETKNAHKVKEGFQYSSGDNSDWETIDSLRNKIKMYLVPDFNVG